MLSMPISRYEIMKSCWSLKPRERPTFQHLVGQFTSIMEKSSGYLELSQAPSQLDFLWKDTSHPPPSSPPTALPVLQEQEEPKDGNEDGFWNKESPLLMWTQVKILSSRQFWQLASKSVCVYYTWSCTTSGKYEVLKTQRSKPNCFTYNYDMLLECDVFRESLCHNCSLWCTLYAQISMHVCSL